MAWEGRFLNRRGVFADAGVALAAGWMGRHDKEALQEMLG